MASELSYTKPINGSGCFSGHPTHNPPSKWKTYGFIVTIIVGVGGLAVGGAGAAGYFHVGALSNLAQIDAIIMMAVGGGGGVILLIVGIVRTVSISSVDTQARAVISGKNESKFLDVKDNNGQSLRKKNLQHIGSTQITTSAGVAEDRTVYGPEVWPELGKKYGCKLQILDKSIPDAPKEAVEVGRVRIYIPQTVRVNEQEQEFTYNQFIRIFGKLIGRTQPLIQDQFGGVTASGWIEIDRDVIQESRSKQYHEQQEMVKKKKCRMPSLLEAVVANLMVFAFTNEQLYGMGSYTHCIEQVYGTWPVLVGGFSSNGLAVFAPGEYKLKAYGVAALRKF